MCKKRLFSSLLIASLVIGIAGCGQPGTPSDSAPTQGSNFSQEIDGQGGDQNSNSQVQDSGPNNDQASQDMASQSGPGPDGKYSDEEYNPKPAKADFDVNRKLSDIELNEEGSQLLSHVSGVYAEPFELYLAVGANGNLSQSKL